MRNEPVEPYPGCRDLMHVLQHKQTTAVSLRRQLSEQAVIPRTEPYNLDRSTLADFPLLIAVSRHSDRFAMKLLRSSVNSSAPGGSFPSVIRPTLVRSRHRNDSTVHIDAPPRRVLPLD